MSSLMYELYCYIIYLNIRLIRVSNYFKCLSKYVESTINRREIKLS
jgi:hypothetical protein